MVEEDSTQQEEERESPGSVMEELVKMKEVLQKEDPVGGRMAEEEEKTSKLEQAEEMMAKAKATVKRKINVDKVSQ